MAEQLTLNDTARMNIRTRLALGYAAILSILVVSVTVTLWSVSQVEDDITVMIEDGVPAAVAGTELAGDVHASLAALRGWMLTANPDFKTQRAEVWGLINEKIEQMDLAAQNWDSENELQMWAKITENLKNFRATQNTIENVAHSESDLPATNILNTQATPLTDSMLRDISRAINAEKKLDANAERKNLLGLMGDIRGALAVSAGNVRAYLLSGEEHYQKQYKAVWGWSGKLLKSLLEQESLLTEGLLKSVQNYSASYDKVTPLFEEMFAIRSSEQWNKSRYLLVTDAAPLAEELQSLLTGNNETGDLGLVDIKRMQMNQDGIRSVDAVSGLKILVQALLVAGLIVAGIIIVISSRAIANPVRALTDVMTKLADGETKIEIPGVSRGDEIGAMAGAVEIFKNNAIERERLENDQKRDHEKTVERERQREGLSQGFDNTASQNIRDVTTTAEDMRGRAENMSKLAADTNALSAEMAVASSKVSDNVNAVSSASSDVSASVRDIESHAFKCAEIAEGAVKEAEQTNHSIENLSKAAGRIDEVVKLITDVAEQTNLLALNATIEAARAGEAGTRTTMA